MIAPRTLEEALEPTADSAWILSEQDVDWPRHTRRESPFAISNGFLGVRGGGSIEAAQAVTAPPSTLVAGLFDLIGVEGPMESLVAAPDWLRLCLTLSVGESLVTLEDGLFRQRALDLKRGVLLTESRAATVTESTVRLRALRLVSLSARAVGLQLAQVEVEDTFDATLEASFGSLDFGLISERLEQDLGVWRTNSSAKRLAIAAAASLRIDGRLVRPEALGPFRWAWTWRARPRQMVLFERVVAVTRHDSRTGRPGSDARRKLAAARAREWNGVLEDHEASWASRWHQSDVMIGGDSAAQQALRFAVYHLNGAANPADDHVSIAARALTGGDYHGHIFWDTEIFLLPFYTLTWPEAARTLLRYRFRTLDAARAKAASMGWRGALYAWESAASGVETTPRYAIGPDHRLVEILCGVQEQHISADIAYAVWHYWHATGDDAFMRDAGAEILLETARFWSSRAQLEADGKRHIRGVIGPDEYHETIDDNAFTNVMARWNIRCALDVGAQLRRQWPEWWTALANRIGLDDAELGEWAGVADSIVSGLDTTTGLFEQFEGFFSLEYIDLAPYAGRSMPMDVVLGRERIKTAQVIKQADVVALLALLPQEFEGRMSAANFNYYEPRCSHGSSLSAAMHGLAAARLGQSEMALRFLRQASAVDLGDVESAADGGVHVAALGGIWMMTVLGFAGLAVEDDGIRLDPRLPSEWRSLAFMIQWRGRHLAISIDGVGHTIRATLESGDAMMVTVADTRRELCSAAPVFVFATSTRP